MSLRLLYLTRHRIYSKAAQGKQIFSMAKAFNNLLKDDFLIITSDKVIDSEQFKHKSCIFHRFRILKIFGLCIQTSYFVCKRSYNIIFTRDIFIAFLTVLLGGKVIYEVHKEPKSHITFLITRILCEYNQFNILCISMALYDYYTNKFNIQRNQISYYHDGVFTEDYESLISKKKHKLRDKISLPHDRLLVVHTGSLYRGRGVHLFEAIASIDNNILFVQVGGRESDITYWEKFFLEKNIKNIKFVGHQDHKIVRYYQVCADYLFYMITRETQTFWCCSPLKVFEYMASGTPIIAGICGSLKEVLNDTNSFIFDPDDPATISVAYKAARNKKQALRNASNARHEAINTYNWNIRVQKIIEYFE